MGVFGLVSVLAWVGSCPLNQSQNDMAQAILDVPFHCGAFLYEPSIDASDLAIL